MKTWTIYRHYAKDDTCLYVGMTSDLHQRSAKHAGESEWWGEVHRTHTYGPIATIDEARLLERIFIAHLQPRHNVLHRSAAKKVSTADDLTGRTLRHINTRAAELGYRVSDLARVVEMSDQNMRWMLATGGGFTFGRCVALCSFLRIDLPSFVEAQERAA